MAKKQKKGGRGRGNPPRRKRVRRRPKKKKILAFRIPVDEEPLYDLANSTAGAGENNAQDDEKEAEDRDTFRSYMENLPSVPVDKSGRRM